MSLSEGKLLRDIGDFIVGLYEGPGGAAWSQGAVDARAALARLLLDKLASLPDPRQSMVEWEDCWSSASPAWSALLRLALTRATLDPRRADLALAGTGVTRWTVEPADGDGALDNAEDQFMCEVCGGGFSSLIGLGSHR